MYIMCLILYNDFVFLVKLLCMIPSNIHSNKSFFWLCSQRTTASWICSLHLIELSKCFWGLTFNAQAVSRLGESKSVSEYWGSAKVKVRGIQLSSQYNMGDQYLPRRFSVKIVFFCCCFFNDKKKKRTTGHIFCIYF